MSATIKNRIGGSDVAAIVGLHPYKSALEVYARIVEGYEPEFDREQEDRMKAGKFLEPLLMAALCEHHGVKPEWVQPNVDRSVTGAPYLGGETDALMTGRFVGEFKCPWTFRQLKRWQGPDGKIIEGSDQVPDEHICQTAWYTWLFDQPCGEIVALLEGVPRHFHYERNAELEATLEDKARKFWRDHIETKTPPSLVGADREVVAAIFPTNNGKLREASPDEAVLIGQFESSRDLRKSAEDRENEIKGQLQTAIAHEDGLYCPLGKVTWKQVKKSPETDWEAACREAGVADEIIAKHTKTNPGYRRFLFTPKKG